MENFIFAKSQRNGEIFIYKEFVYNLGRKNENETRWRCKKRSCAGYILVKENLVVQETAHDHPADPEGCKKIILMNKIKTTALESYKRKADVITEITSALPDED